LLAGRQGLGHGAGHGHYFDKLSRAGDLPISPKW
jgi:hypothetical protein